LRLTPAHLDIFRLIASRTIEPAPSDRTRDGAGVGGVPLASEKALTAAGGG